MAVSLSITQHLRRITVKTVPIYIAIAILLFLARPEIIWFIPGFALVAVGEGVRIWAAGHLRKTQEVTTTGPYAYVKNPLYLGTLLILIGFCLIAANWWLMAIGLAIFFVYYAPFKKSREGKRLLDKFGQEWEDYDQNVPDYIPRVFPYENRRERTWTMELFLVNSEDGTLLSVVLGVVLLALRFYY